jgi:alkylation response protein AidB-like acyl-CoA dehydrogenase
MGVQQAIFRVDQSLGGPPSGVYDSFHELIVWQELARVSLNSVTFMLGIDSMALPPIVHHGSDFWKQKIVPRVVEGSIHVALAISEPTAGSDVANIRATAVRDGDSFVINGEKKWITGATICEYFTLVVRTGDETLLPGAKGISIIIVPANTPGISVRPMKMQFDSVMYTGFVTFENVRVPKTNLVGPLNGGFKIIMENFNHERFIIAASAIGCARRSFELSLKHAMRRKTFGKPMIQHQIIRFKLAEMARTIESMQAQIEQIAYIFDHSTPESNQKAIGELCALSKVHCTKGLEYCAREASQIFGGSSLVREGVGKEVEAFYRNVRSHAIPGGSEEILLDLAIRSATGTKQSKL